MKNSVKYQKRYFLPDGENTDWLKADAPSHAPVWCSVDLRDGNQALVEPMGVEAKKEFFRMLTELGFKEIEIGFPAANETEFEFVRALIRENLIPDDVNIQVLTPAREPLICRTFEAIKGAKNVTVHLYSCVSHEQCKQVYGGGMSQAKELAVRGATCIKELAEKADCGNIRFEYSMESFTTADPKFSLEVCNAVLEVWQPTKEKKAIIDLAATVETCLPHVFASLVEYIRKNLAYREGVILSVHPHNDRGSAVAASEMALLAGAERIEGTLFGNGERTGNVDLVTRALNLYSHGVDPKLNLENLPYAASVYSCLTGMKIPPRQPYAGELVFAAFSGTHQDAIAKGMRHREEQLAAGEEPVWSVPYLPVDPRDLGREYERDVIRINSQSGKSGVGYVLERAYALTLPSMLKRDFSVAVKRASEKKSRELKPEELYALFVKTYVENDAFVSIKDTEYRRLNGIEATVTLEDKQTGGVCAVKGRGNGRIDAVCNALGTYLKRDYTVNGYEQHMLTEGSSSKAISYLSIRADGRSYWGVGIHDDATTASVRALCAAVNNMLCFSEE